MSELGPEAQALVRAARGSHRPSPADRERVARALQARLESGAGATGGAPVTPGVGPSLGGKLLLLVGTGLVVGGALVAWSFGERQAEVTPSPVVAPLVKSVADPLKDAKSEPGATTAVASPTPVETSPLEPRAVSPRRASSRLAEEVSILSRAETELHAGRAASALAVLEEHGQKFPRGALTQERIAAKIHALCALGRVTEAESELARLKRVSPGSPQEGRAREACAPSAKR